MNDSGSFSKAAQHVISGVAALAQKIIVHDDGPILERLRQGDFAETPSLLSEVDCFLQDAIPRLAEYDRHIALLEEAFQQLKDARDDFKRSTDLRRSLLTPVRRLPEDVLVEIFSLYIQDCGALRGIEERTYSLSLSKDLIYSPSFTLSGVCSFWRRVAFSRPTFWPSFALDLEVLGAFEGATNITTILSECLSRSANARLSFYIEFGDSDWEDILDLFLKQAARWEHLNLFFQSGSMSRFISQLQSGEQPPIFSSLRHLNIDEQDFSNLLPIFLRTSHLETLSTGYRSMSWSHFCQYDFSSLKKLEMLGPSGGSIEQFLAHIPSLEVCNLISTHGFTADVKHMSTLYTSNLRHLSVCLDSTCPVEVWQFLRMPHLVCFSLLVHYWGARDHAGHLSLMLIRSKSVLQELTLYDISAHEAINFINAHPSLNKITLSGFFDHHQGTQSHGNLFSCLTIFKDGNETIPGPNLQSLTIQIEGTITGFSHALAQNIVEMVISRADVGSLPSGVSVLQKFSLNVRAKSGDFFDHIRTSLAHLVASGLQLELDHHILTFSHF